jgi:hypothetical protein
MAWITLTSEDVKRRLTKPEIDRVPSVAKLTSQTAEGLLASATDEIVREVRGHVAGGKNILGAAGTIPDELENAALALIRRVVFGRVPGLEDLFGDIRKAEASDAQSLLRRVADGKFAIVPPTAPAPGIQQAGKFSAEVITSRDDIVGGGRVSGL